jgi:hypothetical protein
MGYKYKLKEVKVGDVDIAGGVKSTVTDIDPQTGGITWDVDYIPNVGELVKDVNGLTKTAKEVAVKVKNDPKFRNIYDDTKLLRNKIRTHVRNNYPEEYRKAVGVSEADLDEMSTTGGGAGAASFTAGTGMQYATPYAFKKPKKKKKKSLQEGIGASLGPGPKASEDGVKDNTYVKQFGYKLVPKKIKGSGLEVKQLFEDSDVKSFQQERISSFDVIEQEMNDIYKMLSNAKNETSDYYTQNPSSFNVIKPTDLVLDYIKDIKDLLKGE